jgi:adenylate cyclase
MPSSSKKPISRPTGLVRRTEIVTRILTAVLGALLTVAAGYLALSKLCAPLVNLSYDMPYIFHRAGVADDIRMVFLTELDQHSLDRRPQTKLLDQLGAAGARMVVYDVIFDIPSADPQVDKEFADAIRRFRGVDADGNRIQGMPRREVLLGCARDVSWRSGHIMEFLSVPTDILLNVADDFGVVAFEEDSFTIRKLTTGTRDEPSLGWKAARAAGARLTEDSRMDPRWINYAGPPAAEGAGPEVVPILSCEAESVIAGETAPGFFRDKIVLIGGRPGVVGQELGKDLFATPFHEFPVRGKIPYMSGIEIQANALANLLHGNWLVRSTPRFDSWLILMGGVLAGVGLTLLKPVRAILTATALGLALAIAGVVAMHWGRWWFPWTAVAFLQLPVASVWALASNTYLERFLRIRLTEEQAAIREAFAKYLSPQMLDRLTEEGYRANLGGDTVEVAMMFTDLEAFTYMCERVRNPERIVDTLNEYFERTTRSIFEHDGVVIKYNGDAIFAAWGTPLRDTDASNHAAAAAWRLHEMDRLEVDGQRLPTRIGLHYGEVVAGNIGSSNRLDFTLVGDSVNLASRLEGINKVLGTRILMSEALKARLDAGFRSRRVGRVRVKGRKEPVVIHELLGPVGQEDEPEWISTYHRAIEALEAGNSSLALKCFGKTDSLRDPAGDGPSQFFRERILAGDLAAGGIAEIREK